MAWAKVDDGWWAHPKVMGLPLAARGLWVSALSWSCHQRRDEVPAQFLALVGAELVDADALVDAGLWHEIDGGWVIHDWAEYQDMSLSEKRAEAGRKGGEKSAESRRSKQSVEANAKQTKQSVEANAEAGTHPVPTQPHQHTPSSADADGAPDPFDEFWSACPRKVGKAEARRKFAKATKATDPAVLIEAMRTHAAHWRAHRTEERFIPHPATWLHQGRWLDELVSPSSNDPPEFHRSAVLERNEARARGEACELCSGTGWQPIDGTNDAEPCDCTRRETA